MRNKGKLVLATMVAAGALAGLSSTAAAAAPAERTAGDAVKPVVHVAPTAPNTRAAGSGGVGGDFTGDGRPDVLARDAYYGSLHVYQHSGNYAGTATYSTVHLVDTGWSYMKWIGAADMDGDDLADVVSVDSYGDMRIAVNDASRAPALNSNVYVNSGWGINDLVTVVDYNGDGYDDLLARRAGTTSFYVYYNNGGVNGTATFAAPQLALSGLFVDSISVADLTLDGVPDLIFVRQGKLYLYELGGDVFLLGTGWDTVDQISLTEVNGDGRPDVLARKLSNGALQTYTHTGHWNPSGTNESYVLNPPVVLGTNWFIHNLIT